ILPDASNRRWRTCPRFQESAVRDRQGYRALYVISIPADLTGGHPQTLRIYEEKGLLSPQRRNRIRLYADRDIERVRMIRHLTQELGVNLAGVKLLLEGYEQRGGFGGGIPLTNCPPCGSRWSVSSTISSPPADQGGPWRRRCGSRRSNSSRPKGMSCSARRCQGSTRSRWTSP